MLASACLFSGQLAIFKAASVSIHPFELSFLRNLFALAPLVIMAIASPPAIIVGVPLLVLRAMLGVGGSLALFYANAHVPLATVAILFHARVFPLSVMARLLLHEQISVSRWVAIAVGFSGVVIVCVPAIAGSATTIGITAAVIAALLSSGSQISVKALTRSNTPLTVAFFGQLALSIFSAPAALAVWSWPIGRELLLITAAAVAGGLAAYAAARAFSLASASSLGSADNTGIIVSGVLGFAIFGEVPHWTVFAGAVLMFGAAHYIARWT